jgi:selenocysteine-specific elongation factor
VEREVAALLEGTVLAGIPVLPVSAIAADRYRGLARAADRSGAGAGRARHAGPAFQVRDRPGLHDRGQRHGGDRHGYSTAAGRERRQAGHIAERRGRSGVRSIQVRGIAAERAGAGERCALNLAGQRPRNGRARRLGARGGDTRADPEARCAGTLLEGEPLEHWTPLHLHLATADVTARIAIPKGAAIEAGEPALAQLVLDKPVGALNGDRFILRDQSARRTLGGGVVLDPFAPSARRAARTRQGELTAFETGSLEGALGTLLDSAEAGVDLDRLERVFNVTPAHAQSVYAKAGIATLEKSAASPSGRTAFANGGSARSPRWPISIARIRRRSAWRWKP